uniref:Uncharacterized protein n=1 Tax=Plectus sambesii TaxID=2011161 RepID=A0A914UMG6_9BILA
VLSVPRRQRSSTTPRSQSPAPSDSVSYSGSISRTGGTPRHNDSFASSPMPARSVSSVRPPVPVVNNRPAKIGLDSSQDGSEDDEEEEAMTPQVAEPPQHFHQKMSKEEEERIKYASCIFHIVHIRMARLYSISAALTVYYHLSLCKFSIPRAFATLRTQKFGPRRTLAIANGCE